MLRRRGRVHTALLLLAAGAGAGVLIAFARNATSGEVELVFGRRAMPGRARMCLRLLHTEPELAQAQPWTVLHECVTQITKAVEKWKTSDECQECKNTGGDCDKCAAVAQGKAKGTYSGGGKGGGWKGDDGDISDADIKEMEEFFKNDPVFQDIIKNDPDLKKEFGGGFMPPGVSGFGDAPLTPEEEKMLEKFEKELEKAIQDEEALEAAEKAKNKGKGKKPPAKSANTDILAPSEAGLPLALELPLSNVLESQTRRTRRNSMHWLD